MKSIDKIISKIADSTIMDYGSLVNLNQSKYKKGWLDLKIDIKYKSSENYDMYCYLKYMCIDADQVFIEEIKKYESAVI